MITLDKLTQETIKEIEWQTLPNPPYSPDLAPSNVYLFVPLKGVLPKKKLNNLKHNLYKIIKTLYKEHTQSLLIERVYIFIAL